MRPARSRSAIAALLLGLSAPVALAQPGSTTGDASLRSYLSANGMLARGMNELAEQEYRKFLSEHADHDRAPHARYGLAVALFRQKKFDDAAGQLAGLPDLPGFEFATESGFLLAQCAVSGGHPENALKPLQQLVKEHRSHDLADDAAALLVECLYRAGRFDDSISAASALKAAVPESPLRDRAEYFAALSEIKKGDEKDAAERLSRLASQWPASALADGAQLLAAQCAHRAGGTEAAKRAYESVLAMKGSASAPDALLGLASLEHAAGELGPAREHLDRLLEEFPDSPQAVPARLARARVMIAAGEYDSARAELVRYATSPGADGAQAAFWSAKCRLKSGDAGQAARVLETALEALPKDHELRPSMMYDLALAQIEDGDQKGATATLTRFQAEYPKDALGPQAAEALATILHRAGDYGKSLAICEDFRSRYPGSANLTKIDLLAAENEFLSDDLSAAEKGYVAFLHAHPDDAGAALAGFRLGCVYFRQGKHGEAAPLLEEAAGRAAKDATYRPALLYLGDIAFQAGKWEDASERLAAYVDFGKGTPGADEALLKRGIALENLGKHEEAAECLRRVVQEHPDSPRRAIASLELARSLVSLERGEEAEELLRGLTADKDTSVASLARNRLALLASAKGDTKGAIELFRTAAESGDDRAAPEALQGLGSALLASGDNAGAVSAFDKLIDGYPAHPRIAEARAQRAIAAARGHADEQSLAGLTAALKSKGDLAPELRDALRFEQAVCLRALGRDDEATRTLGSLSQGASTPGIRVRAALELARTQMEASDPATAAETLRSIASVLSEEGIEPELREHAEYQLAAAEFRQDRFKPAGELFAAFVKAHPRSALLPSASLLAGESLVRQERHAAALPYLKSALASELSDADRQSAYLRLGEASAATQDWTGSQEAFGTFLEKFPSSELWFQARFGRGWALENQGKRAEAMAEYAKVTATHQGPTAARAQFQIGECLFAEGKTEDAVRELLKVDILYAYPEWSAAAMYEAGRCFEAMNQPDKALEQYRQVNEKHGQTQWAGLASKRLSALGSAERTRKN